MFRAPSAQLQEDTVVHMQHMVLSLSMRVRGGLSIHSLSSYSSWVPTGRQELWQYHMLHVYNCNLLKMSTWGSKHVEENSILWINNNQVHSLSSHSSCVPTGHQDLWQYHMLHVYNCILLKMSTWGSKHVVENIILWINNNQVHSLSSHSSCVPTCHQELS